MVDSFLEQYTFFYFKQKTIKVGESVGCKSIALQKRVYGLTKMVILPWVSLRFVYI
ncbi:hypothetical protein KCTC52924_02735 [Arenibacter antarcticus]